jgi:protein SCO1
MKKKLNPVLMLVLFLVGMPVLSVAVIALTGNFEVKELPVLGQVPEFRLTERSGEPYGSNELRGKVWVAGFIFTSCSMQCPIITGRLQSLQTKFRFKENWRAVAFTTDPDSDTVSVLKDYAVKAKADPYKWLFLTGPKNELTPLISNGFKLASDPTNPTIHSEKLVLVDHLSRIRGYYDANDEAAVKKLVKDTKALIKKAPITSLIGR